MSPVALTRPKPRSRKGEITGQMVFFALFAFFSVVIGVNALMAKLALATNPGTIVDSSYRASNNFGKEIAAYRAQEARGWTSDASIDERAGRTTLAVVYRDKDGQPARDLDVTVRFVRPVDRAGDVVATARPSGAGAYVAEATLNGRGIHDVEIIARRDGEILHKTMNRVQLAGPAS